MAKLTVGHENSAPIELHYDDVGNGKPVVLIHGWPLSGRSWERQVPALVAAGYRVVTYDRRGFGWSSQPWSGYDYDTLAADLDALLRQLDLREVTLVGFSMGGGEVARYLGKYGSERIARAVFCAAVTPCLYKSAAQPDGLMDDAAIAGFEGAVAADRMAFVDGFLGRYFLARGTQQVSAQQRQYHLDIAAFASPRATMACIGAFSRTDFREDLAKIRVPTLVLHGDADEIVPFPVSGKRTAAAIPGARQVLIPDGPHGVNTSHAQAFNEALLDFLSAEDAQRPPRSRVAPTTGREQQPASPR